MDTTRYENEKHAVNVDQNERIISVLAGLFFLYKGLKGKVKITDLLAGGLLVARGYTGFCPVYSYAGRKNIPNPDTNINLRATAFIGRPVMEVYAYWRDLTNLPDFFKHIKSVIPVTDTLSIWTTEFAGFEALTWEAEIVKDEPGIILAWRSVPGAKIRNAGKVEFVEAGPASTRVNVVITYASKGGIGVDLALKAINPLLQKMVASDMEEFKKRVEDRFPLSIR